MRKTWKTKYGSRRVRHDPPTVEEAIIAASGMTDDVQAQIDIAASLMEVSPDEVRAAMAKAATRRQPVRTTTFAGRPDAPRAVVVERKINRRFSTGTFAR